MIFAFFRINKRHLGDTMSTITNTNPTTQALSDLFANRTSLYPQSESKEMQAKNPALTDNAKPDMLEFLQNLAPSAPVSSVSGVGQTNSEVPVSSEDSYVSLSRIQDVFTPSKELSAAMNAKSYVQDGFADVDKFKSMAKQLQSDGVLNHDDMMAVDFLSAKSPNISFKDFDAMIRNDNLSREMRTLIAQLVQKLHMVNYVSGGIMNA